MEAATDYLRPVAAAYGEHWETTQIEPLGSAGGFSGARFWKIRGAAGNCCLRRWPRPHPSCETLAFLHALMRHAARAGFHPLAVPQPARDGRSVVVHDGHFWELSPWLPGRANFHEEPTPAKLAAAMQCLAQFHLAVADFPITGPRMGLSPGLAQRYQRLQQLQAGEADRILAAVTPQFGSDLQSRAQRVVRLFRAAAASVSPLLEMASTWQLPLQPCLCDVWHDHILFDGSRVSGLIDFGSAAVEDVSADVGRLLGSLTVYLPQWWTAGLSAYTAVRPLAPGELEAVYAFERANALMSGMVWLDWLYRERRDLGPAARVLQRLDQVLTRLERL